MIEIKSEIIDLNKELFSRVQIIFIRRKIHFNYPLHLNTPNCISPLPKAQSINKIVGISLKDLNNDDKPNDKNTLGLLTPSKIDSHQDGNVSFVPVSYTHLTLPTSHLV